MLSSRSTSIESTRCMAHGLSTRNSDLVSKQRERHPRHLPAGEHIGILNTSLCPVLSSPTCSSTGATLIFRRFRDTRRSRRIRKHLRSMSTSASHKTSYNNRSLRFMISSLPASVRQLPIGSGLLSQDRYSRSRFHRRRLGVSNPG